MCYYQNILFEALSKDNSQVFPILYYISIIKSILESQQRRIVYEHPYQSQ